MEEQYYENILNIKTSGKQELEEATRYYNSMNLQIIRL